MRSREKQALKVFRRVRDFLKEKAPAVGYGSVEGVITQLTDAIDQLEGYAREQDARQRQLLEATRRQRRQAAGIRREFITPVSRGARLLFPSEPTLLDAFAMPAARDYIGTIAAAEAMAQLATQYAEKFTGVGLPPDFVARMQKAVVELRAQLDARATDVGVRSASTSGLRTQYTRGRELVRMLDAMVAPRLADAPPRLAEWKALSRFLRIASPAPAEETPVSPSSVIPPETQAA